MNETTAAERSEQAREAIRAAYALMAELAKDCLYHQAPPALAEGFDATAVAEQRAWAATMEATRLATRALGCTCGLEFYFGYDVPRVAGDRYIKLLDAAEHCARYASASLPDLHRALWEVSVWTVRGGIYPLRPDFTAGRVLAESR
jgi:hypothetical protein